MIQDASGTSFRLYKIGSTLEVDIEGKIFTTDPSRIVTKTSGEIKLGEDFLEFLEIFSANLHRMEGGEEDWSLRIYLGPHGRKAGTIGVSSGQPFISSKTSWPPKAKMPLGDPEETFRALENAVMTKMGLWS